ncbi:glycosyltransferase [Myxococcota bacterium]|nr:glycosyltransferase [Myxococcota bacterium]
MNSEATTRILLIAPQPFYAPRGTPMNVLQMCRVLTGAGIKVDLVTFPLGEDVELPGLEIHRALRCPWIDSVPIGFSKQKVVLDLLLAIKVFSLWIRRRYAAVHAVEEAVFLALPLTWLGAKLVYDLDSSISQQLAYSGAIRRDFLLTGVQKLEQLALRRAKAAVTVCRSLTEFAAGLAPSTPAFQIEDTPLPESLRDADPVQVERLRENHQLHGRRVVLYTGNLEGYQGLDLLLEAAPLVRERVPEVLFLLVGGEEGDVRACRETIRHKGLAGSVAALGAKAPSSMPEWMALAEVLVSPRTQGGNTPLKIYTYMRAERPIVATRLETHTQVLDDSCAILRNPDATDFADGVASVLEAPDLHAERARVARKLVDTEYGFDAFGRKLLATYQSLGIEAGT